MTYCTPSLLAFGFSTPAMLGWLVAAAVPLVIHLWSRRKHREAPWAAVEFLLAAMRKNARRIQFEQWLLLALRTLIILLVVLAVAEPYTQQLSVFMTPYRPTHKVFVLDGSYSMAYREADESRFEQARQLIFDIVDQSRAGDGFSLVLMGEPSRGIVQSPARSQADFLDELATLEQPHTGGNLLQAVALADDAIERAETGPAPLKQHEVFLVSDLGRTSWQHRTEEAGPVELTERLERLARRAAVVVLDVGQESAVNSAVTSISIEEPFVAVRRPTTFTATLRNFGRQARSQVPVEFQVDRDVVQTRRVRLPADESVRVSFTHTFEAPGPHTATVKLAQDALALDDRRHLAFTVREELAVLLVAGKRGATEFLAAALNPAPATSGLITTRTVSEIALAETLLADYDCIFLANVAQFTSGERRLLEDYLAQGGSLVIFLGDQVMPQAYNSVLADTLTEQQDVETSQDERSAASGSHANRPTGSVLPVRLGDLVRQEGTAINPLDYRHPIVSDFRGREQAGLLTTPIRTYRRLVIPADQTQVETVLATGDGDPLIVTSAVGKGRCTVVATAASTASVDEVTGRPWTAWPVWPSFLPIVRETLFHSIAGQDAKWNAQVGEPLEGTGTRPGEVALTVTDPAGQTHSVQSALDRRGGWRLADTQRSGVYEVRTADGADVAALAVNLDTTESDLTRIDPASLPEQLALRSTWQNTQAAGVEDLLGEQRLQRWLLSLAIGLMLLETCLARWFGRGAA